MKKEYWENSGGVEWQIQTNWQINILIFIKFF